VYVNIGNSLFDSLQNFDVRVAVNRWMKATKKSDFSRTDLARFYRSFDDLIDRQEIGLRVVLSYAEGAKTARPDADVCKVDVSIDDVAHVVADALLPNRIGDGENGMEVGSAHVKQTKGLIFVDSITALSVTQDVRYGASLYVPFHEAHLSSYSALRYFSF
jgi:hypothetical protein